MLLIFLVFCIVFLFVVFGLFCFDCHRLVSCVASVASVSGLSILDHLLQFPPWSSPNQQGGKQHNTMQKTKKIGSMDPTKIAVLISISPNNFHFTYYEEE
jgi:hypothetical protein